ncbi:MAG: hypothetical protein ABI240_11835 [Sphingomonas sp.]
MAFELVQTPLQPVTASWRVRSSNGESPSNCFVQTAGTVNTSRLVTEFNLTLKPESTCETRRFALDITVLDPALPASAPFVAPYMSTIEFVPGPKKAIQIGPLTPRSL